MVGLHGPPPTVLLNGDHWQLMVLATGYHSIVMLRLVGHANASKKAASATLIAECYWTVRLQLVSGYIWWAALTSHGRLPG